MATEKTKSKSEIIWKCLNCEEQPEFSHKKMMKHLEEVHHIDVKTDKAKKTMMSHLDGQKFFTSVYEFEINGLKFIQSTYCERSKEDEMYWY